MVKNVSFLQPIIISGLVVEQSWGRLDSTCPKATAKSVELSHEGNLAENLLFVISTTKMILFSFFILWDLQRILTPSHHCVEADEEPRKECGSVCST